MTNQCNRSARLNARAAEGFTLLEVMIALCILSIGLLGMAGMQVYANSKDNEARFYTEANTMATQLVEGLMSLDFDDPDLNGNTTGQGLYHDRISAANRTNIEGQNPPEEGLYNYGYRVQDDRASNPTYKIIRLAVEFYSRAGQGGGSVNLTQLKPRAHEIK
jgi:type IV pilus modification protein PilV